MTADLVSRAMTTKRARTTHGRLAEHPDIGKARVYRSIIDDLTNAIRSGLYSAGSALPSERQLAQTLRVSRASVREAVRVLESAGVVDVRTGIGTYITEAAMSQSTMLRAAAAAIGEYSPLDVVAVRKAIEPLCANLAARERSEHELLMLTENLEHHARLLQNGADPRATGRRFHLLLVAATHNLFLRALEERIADALDQTTWKAVRPSISGTGGHAESHWREHQSILSAIRDANALQAASAMRIHIDAIADGMSLDPSFV